MARRSFLDRYFLNVSIERALFNAYIIIFLTTSLVTLLGITNLIKIDKQFLNILFKVLIVEVVGGITALFSTRLIKKSSDLKIRLNFRTRRNREMAADDCNPSEIKLTYTFIDPETGKEKQEEGSVYKDDVGYCINISPANMKRTISIVAEINGKIYQGSDWLETRTIDLKAI